MCGIIGSYGKAISEDVFEKGLHAIAHRGPNASAVYHNRKCGVSLGHRRLSIIDLSEAGTQPLWSADKRYAIIFNGEIYNYLELKKELAPHYSFRTQTDTEVLLAAYIVWGNACLAKCNGMFAFAIWDEQEEKLFIARDRLGVKPLFYSTSGGRFTFASEIKGLLALGLARATNEDIVFDYLVYGYYDHTNETFFKDISVLPAGHFATLDKSGLKMTRYWDLLAARGTYDYSYKSHEELYEKLRELLADSIRLRYRSDVPVGLNLSSGLDSNVLLHYAKKITGGDVHAFTMCSVDPEFNECALLEPLLSPAQKEHWYTSTLLPDEVPALAETMNRIQDQPYGGIPTIAYAKLSRQAFEKGVTVLLEGQGMDELLAGYKYYRTAFVKDLWEGGHYLKLLEYARRQKASGFGENLKNIWHDRTAETLTQSQDATQQIDHRVLARSMRGARLDDHVVFEKQFDSHLQNAQYRDLLHTKLPRVLRFNDHAAMAYGREVRMPYLDYRVVEYCFWLPAHFKVSYNSQKVLLRKAFRELLPEFIRQKQKVAFGAWQTKWFRDYGREYVYDIIESSSFKERGYWDMNELRTKIDAFYRGEGNNSFFLWQCINLELWARAYIDSQ